MKKTISLFLILFTSVIFAQETYTDATLQNFADAYAAIRVESNQRQLDLLTEIEKTGLTMEQFTDIHIKLRDSSEEGAVTAEQKKQYEVAKENIAKFEKETQKMFEAIIRQNGLTLENYQNISLACKKDPALNEKVMKLINK